MGLFKTEIDHLSITDLDLTIILGDRSDRIRKVLSIHQINVKYTGSFNTESFKDCSTKSLFERSRRLSHQTNIASCIYIPVYTQSGNVQIFNNQKILKSVYFSSGSTLE